MKKIILFLLLYLGLVPVIKKQGISFTSTSKVYADFGDEDGDDDWDDWDDDDWWDDDDPSSNWDVLSDYYGVEITGIYTDEEGNTVFTTEDGYLDPNNWGGTSDSDSNDNDNEDDCWWCSTNGGDDGGYNDDDDGGYDDEDPYDYNEPETPEEQEPPNPCDQIAPVASEATTLFSNTEVQDKLLETNSAVPGFTESGFSIRESAADGEIYTSDIETGTNNSVEITNYQNSIADVHVHANSNYPPSASDIFSLVEISFFGDPPNLKTSYVVGDDGTRYAITVTDQSKISDFYNQMNGIVDPVTHNLDLSSNLGVKFNDAYIYFSATLSNRDAFERATAAILEGSGITLLKADYALNSDFKKTGVESSTDSNGNVTFNTADCP